MKRLGFALAVASVCVLGLFAGSAAAATVTPVASGLDSPRGVAFLPNGMLVVSEAGHGGDVCVPDGPCFGLTSQVSQVNPTTGAHTPLVSGLFSLFDPEGGALGVDDVATQGGRLLGIEGVFPQTFQGVSCNQLPNPPADCPQVLAAAQTEAGALLKFTPGGTFKSVANVGAVDYQFTVDNPGGTTYGEEQDSNPYGLFPMPGGTYVADAGSNVISWASNNGSVSIVHRFPVPDPAEPFPTDAVPTCVAPQRNHLVVADLAGRIWSYAGGSASIISGQTASILTNNHYTGCAADGAGDVYVVSMFSGPFPNPGTGSILEVDSNGNVSTVVSGLVFPNKLAVDPGGALYVSVGSVCTTAPPNPCGAASGGLVKVTP